MGSYQYWSFINSTSSTFTFKYTLIFLIKNVTIETSKILKLFDFYLFLFYNKLSVITYLIIKMAVPKKRTSKTKTRSRKAVWKGKATQAAKKSLSLAKSVLQGKPTSFIYNLYIEE